MKRLLLLALALGAVACTTTTRQTYRSPTDPSVVWKIEGTQSTLGNINLTINGEAALSGKVSMMTGDGEFSGSYQGATLTLKCARGGSSSVRSRCILSRGDERIAVLLFKSL